MKILQGRNSAEKLDKLYMGHGNCDCRKEHAMGS